MPETCPSPDRPEDEVDGATGLDAILADAEGRDDHSDWLSDDYGAWRRGLVDLLDETRADLAGIKAELKALRPDRSYGRRGELHQERAALIERQRALDNKIRYVKSQEGPRTPATEPGDPISQARAHLMALFDIIATLAAERDSRDTP